MICPLRELLRERRRAAARRKRRNLTASAGRLAAGRIYVRRLEYGCIPRAELRAARANRVFCPDEKRIRTENTVMDKPRMARVFIQDRRLRTDGLFIRA
jgi:hypothetical protein